MNAVMKLIPLPHIPWFDINRGIQTVGLSVSQEGHSKSSQMYCNNFKRTGPLRYLACLALVV